MGGTDDPDDDILSRPPPLDEPDGGFFRFVPKKNPPAVFGYYLAIVSLIPCIGAPFGLAAVPCGIVALRRVRERPEVRGSVHAWIAIVVGGVCGLLWSGLLIAALAARPS